MKKITLLLLLLILPGFMVGQNILVNGDFENTDPATVGQAIGKLPGGADNTIATWTVKSTNATRTSINAGALTAHAGDNYLNLPNDYHEFRQPFTAVAGTEYTLKFWNRFVSPEGQIQDPLDGIFFFIRNDNGDNGTNFSPGISFYIDPTKYDTGWNEIKFSFTAPQTNLVLFAYKKSRTADNTPGTVNKNNAARMDDFSITPTPIASWNGNVNSDWATAGNWSGNIVPDQDYEVIIPASKTVVISSTTGAQALNLTVDPTSTLTINGGGSLNVELTSTGNITYNRTLQGGKWHLVSSPVEGSVYNNTWIADNGIASGNGNNRGIATFQNGTPHLTTGPWVYVQAGDEGTFDTSKGYSLIRTTTGTISFTGTFPKGNKSAIVTSPDPAIITGSKKFNLVGNPYPTYLSVANFFVDNTAASGKLTEDTIWIWDSSANAGMGGYLHKTSGIDGAFQIAPGQAFFINSGNATKISFRQNLGTNQTDSFLKTSKTQVIVKVATNGVSFNTELFYLTDGTNDFENGYDASKFSGETTNFDIYTSQLSDGAKKLGRQVLSISDMETLVVPVGIKAASGQEITFSAEAMNLPEGIKVFLEDREKNTITLLDEANSSYKVTLANAIDGNGRFFLHTKASGVLGTEDVALENASIYKTSNATLRVVGLENGTTSNIKMYNVTGKQVLNSNFQSKGAVEISLPKLATGIYIVQLQNENGSINKKIILE